MGKSSFSASETWFTPTTVSAFTRYRRCSGIRVSRTKSILLDGGTQGLGLLHHVSGVRRLLVIDAIDVGEPCGTVLRFEGKALRVCRGKASVHQLGFADLMIALQLSDESPGEVVVFGVQPKSTAVGRGVNPPVANALAPLIDRVIAQLKSWQEIPVQAVASGLSTELPRKLCANRVSLGLRRRLFVQGIVQGVGFRPWIHQLAQANRSRGYVLNSTLGVTIEIEGPEEAQSAFPARLSHRFAAAGGDRRGA